MSQTTLMERPRCEGCDEPVSTLHQYEARFADAPKVWVRVRYCGGCAELARANWNGETLEIRGPLCVACDGDGHVTVLDPSCPHGGCACPCETAELPCSRCEGSGVEPCDECGEPSIGVDWISKKPACADCIRREDDEPRGDHPLGGMGYGYDFAPALRAARALK